jgi:hypothetical protein
MLFIVFIICSSLIVVELKIVKISSTYLYSSHLKDVFQCKLFVILEKNVYYNNKEKHCATSW